MKLKIFSACFAALFSTILFKPWKLNLNFKAKLLTTTKNNGFATSSSTSQLHFAYIGAKNNCEIQKLTEAKKINNDNVRGPLLLEISEDKEFLKV